MPSASSRTSREDGSAPSPSTSRASFSMVGASNSTCSGSELPNSALILLIRLTATSELPPVPKKSSSTETTGRFMAFFQISPIRASVPVRGSTGGPSVPSTLASSEAARALRSTLPLGVSGSSSSTTTLLGIM